MPETRTIVGITGANGLLGWHTLAHLQARNAASAFAKRPEPFTIKKAHTATFESDTELDDFVRDCDIILHFAGVNRGAADEVETNNRRIAEKLIASMQRLGATPSIVYSNSTHSDGDTPYGRGKSAGAEALRTWADDNGASFADLVLPHLFGEHGRPNYNSVTATFCDHLVRGEIPQMNAAGRVELLHVGQVARLAIEAGLAGRDERIRLKGTPMSIPELWEKLTSIHSTYMGNVLPDLSDNLTLELFNTYRSYIPYEGRVVEVPVHSDQRGRLFEAAKGGGGGQTFISWTEPGVTRGNHFHLNKAERFLVLQGEATIRLRRLGCSEVHEYPVSGATPAYLDIPTLHTHNITNTGDEPLVTLFWAHELFDPKAPDTYMEIV